MQSCFDMMLHSKMMHEMIKVFKNRLDLLVNSIFVVPQKFQPLASN